MMLAGQQSSPAETLFIDDGLKNIQAAQALGMHTLMPENNEDWTKPLTKLLGID